MLRDLLLYLVLVDIFKARIFYITDAWAFSGIHIIKYCFGSDTSQIKNTCRIRVGGEDIGCGSYEGRVIVEEESQRVVKKSNVVIYGLA